MHLPPHIAERIRVTIEGLSLRRGITSIARRSTSALSLSRVLSAPSGCCGQTGLFLDVDSDWGREPRSLESELHVTAIVAGVARYPWLPSFCLSVHHRPPTALIASGATVWVSARST